MLLIVTSVLYTILALPVLLLLYDLTVFWRLPRGPLPLPFVGNRFDLPSSKPWIQFKEWSNKYGPIFTVWIGRRPTLVISDPIIAVDLMEKRSAKFSSRPRMVVMGEIYSGNSSILMQPYGKAWSIRRKLLHQALSPKALQTYISMQEAEASRLVTGLLTNSTAWVKEVERFTASVVFCVAYGHRVDSLTADVVTQRLDFMHYMASLNIPGKFLAETFPFLAKIPTSLASWKREIQDMGKREAAANLTLFQMVEKEVNISSKTGDSVPDSLSKLLLHLRDEGQVSLSASHLSYIPASLFGAGSDTTASTLCFAFLAFITHPHTLIAAQAELDRVIGHHQTPRYEHTTSLPYLQALCKEVLRWRPVAVLGGTPHASSVADTYNDYHIPAGTTILGNSWAINLNEEFYPSPHTFEPARFLTGSDILQGARKHPSASGHSSFGWGRRICPGAALAESSLCISLAKIVWAFDVLPLEGREYDIMHTTEGFNIRPKDFDCVFRVRDGGRERVIREEVEGSLRVLARFSPLE